MQTIRQAELHLVDVTTERSVYQGALEKAKLSVCSGMCHWMHFLDLQQLDRWPNDCTVLTVFFSSGQFAERMMAVLFCWHTQHRSLIGFITITLGSSCRQR